MTRILSCHIAPYQFEPLATKDASAVVNNGSLNADILDGDGPQSQAGNTDWCTCGNCLPTLLTLKTDQCVTQRTTYWQGS